MILDTELVEWTGRWILPDTESQRLPVTDAAMFSWFRSDLSPRNAKIKASLKMMVSLSAISMAKPSLANLDLNKSIKQVLNEPPPDTKIVVLLFCLEKFSASIESLPLLHVSANLLATCSVNVLSKSGIRYFTVWKSETNNSNIHLHKILIQITSYLYIFLIIVKHTCRGTLDLATLYLPGSEL